MSDFGWWMQHAKSTTQKVYQICESTGWQNEQWAIRTRNWSLSTRIECKTRTGLGWPPWLSSDGGRNTQNHKRKKYVIFTCQPGGKWNNEQSGRETVHFQRELKITNATKSHYDICCYCIAHWSCESYMPHFFFSCMTCQTVRDWGHAARAMVMKCTKRIWRHSVLRSRLLPLAPAWSSRRTDSMTPITQNRPCLSRRPGLCTAWSRKNAAYLQKYLTTLCTCMYSNTPITHTHKCKLHWTSCHCIGHHVIA